MQTVPFFSPKKIFLENYSPFWLLEFLSQAFSVYACNPSTQGAEVRKLLKFRTLRPVWAVEQDTSLKKRKNSPLNSTS